MASSDARPGTDRKTGASDPVGILSIVGMVRSGSTYLEGRLADLYGGVAVGELVGAWNAINKPTALCACMQPAMECPFWEAVTHRYAGLCHRETVDFVKHMNSSVMPIRNYRKWGKIIRSHRTAELQWYQVEIRKLYSAVHDSAKEFGFHNVMDSSKHPVFYALAASAGAFNGFSRSLAIRLVRDPRAVVHSLTSPKKYSVTTGQDIMSRHGFLRAIPYWLAFNIASDAAVPSGTPLVRYETLAHEPYKAVMADLGFSGGPIDITQNRHQLVGNPVRQEGSKAFTIDRRWNSMSRTKIAVITSALYPWMRHYGYAASPNSHIKAESRSYL